MEVVEGKDKKGRRCIEYLIHFQGKNSKNKLTIIYIFWLIVCLF